jgi:hypothetical protein
MIRWFRFAVPSLRSGLPGRAPAGAGFGAVPLDRFPEEKGGEL